MPNKPTITISQSEARTYKRCQMLHDYRYRRGLEPRLIKRPLKLGSWLHTVLQTSYEKGDWRIALADIVKEDWEPLFEEERAYYGDLPGQVADIMESYEEYYLRDPWKVVMVEAILDTTIETSNLFIHFLGRVDLVAEDSTGNLWCIDHKSSISIPNEYESKLFQSMDTQLTFYPWALEQQYGLKVFGVCYNYARTKTPSIPHLNKDGTLSKAKSDTDERTFRKACKEYGITPEDYPEQLQAAVDNTDSFFYRLRVPRDPHATRTVLQDLVATAIAKDSYTHPTRTVTRECSYCEMKELCQFEFFGMSTDAVLENYKQSDNVYAYLGIKQEEEVSLNV